MIVQSKLRQVSPRTNVSGGKKTMKAAVDAPGQTMKTNDGKLSSVRERDWQREDEVRSHR